MSFTYELKSKLLRDIKILFETVIFQNTRELVISIPCHASTALGIDITRIHDIANYSTTFHHESLYKNASSKYTSKMGKIDN